MLDVADYDGTRVNQAATGQIPIHQFKNYATTNSGTFTWRGRSNTACSTVPVVLQIYNHNSSLWEDLDTDTTTLADTDIELTANVASLTNYKGEGGIVTCRVHQ